MTAIESAADTFDFSGSSEVEKTRQDFVKSFKIKRRKEYEIVKGRDSRPGASACEAPPSGTSLRCTNTTELGMRLGTTDYVGLIACMVRMVHPIVTNYIFILKSGKRIPTGHLGWR